MVEQLTGAQARIAERQQIVVKDHITSCITPVLKTGGRSALNDIEGILQQLMKVKVGQGSHHTDREPRIRERVRKMSQLYFLDHELL